MVERHGSDTGADEAAATRGTGDGGGGSPFDVAIVGGGVVGCAVARRFALDGARVVLLEKAAEILDGASKANSAILHTGFDAPPDSLELACLQAGHEEFMSLCEPGGFACLKTGALVVAWDEAQAAQLPTILARAERNDVNDVQLLDAESTRALEPALGLGVQGSVRVPQEFLIDPWSTPMRYLLQAMALGTRVLRQCELLGGQRADGLWALHTSRGPVQAQAVINCAGLHGDRVDAMLLGTTSFEIRPRKGQFVVYDKPASGLFLHTLLPVPTERTKGVVVCRTVFGNVLVGPTAEEQVSRDEAAVDEVNLRALKAEGERIVPALAAQEITAAYAGLRPASQFKDYQITTHAGHGMITVGAIRSTGLSAALGIARHVRECHDRLGSSELRNRPAGAIEPDEKANRVASSIPVPALAPELRGLGGPQTDGCTVLAEHLARDWQQPGNGGIVCHCERVTRREIKQALLEPLPAMTLAGLKRRTRASLGRCQGFYCLAELESLLDEAALGDAATPPDTLASTP